MKAIKMKTDLAEREVRKPVLRTLLIICGLALMLESALVLALTTVHLGTVMPFVIGLPLFTVGVFLPFVLRMARQHLWARLLVGAMIFVYAAFFLLLAVTTALILTHSAEREGAKPGAVIVLGAGIRGSAPSATLAYRLEKALEYYQKDPTLTIVVSGGQGADEQYTEAEVMAAWLTAHGVSESSIIREERSSSTEENFIFSREALEQAGKAGCETAFVTNRFHVFRAGRIAQKLGMQVYGIPARMYKPLIINDFLRECAAIVQHFLTGRL